MKLFLSTIISFLMFGCMSYTSSIPEGYTGELATIDDSFQRLSRSKASFYYIKLIDGEPIHNSLTASSAASNGKGSQLIAMGASRSIPIKPINLYLIGQVHHSAPIGYIFSSTSNYIIEGEVNFTPKKNEKYLINGSLSEDYSAVWIEDINGNVVSKVIEKRGLSHVSIIDSGLQPQKIELSKKELFLKLASGESENLVVSKLGKPDKITKYGGNFLIEKPPSVTYQYEGLGSIQFSAQKSAALFIERVTPNIEWSDDISSIKMQLNSTGATLQSLAKGYYQQDHIKIEVLDLFAEKIWTEKKNEDPYVIDAVSWLCKVLAKSNNSRYRSILQNIATEANENKLRKHAKNSLDLLPVTDVDQFIPTENKFY